MRKKITLGVYSFRSPLNYDAIRSALDGVACAERMVPFRMGSLDYEFVRDSADPGKIGKRTTYFTQSEASGELGPIKFELVPVARPNRNLVNDYFDKIRFYSHPRRRVSVARKDKEYAERAIRGLISKLGTQSDTSSI